MKKMPAETIQRVEPGWRRLLTATRDAADSNDEADVKKSRSDFQPQRSLKKHPCGIVMRINQLCV